MANMLSPDKRRITYAEYKDVVAEINRIAKERSREERREVTPTEVLRDAVLGAANKSRKKRGVKLLPSDKERIEEKEHKMATH